MFKAELRSKIFQVDQKWRSTEDILTGDFFGALDYLPRVPFLEAFLQHAGRLNPDAKSPTLRNIDWESVELLFWPKTQLEDGTTEPDLVLISNRWVVVVEVKLDSQLGCPQLCREYRVGQHIASERGLPQDDVYLMAVARSLLDVEANILPHKSRQCAEVLAKTQQVQWWQAVHFVDDLIRNAATNGVTGEQKRLLDDLWESLRRRRSLVFSGFSFSGTNNVARQAGPMFCPSRFDGFVGQRDATVSRMPDKVFLSRPSGESLPACFEGFFNRSQTVHAPTNTLFFSGFSGFLNGARDCPTPQTTDPFHAQHR